MDVSSCVRCGACRTLMDGQPVIAGPERPCRTCAALAGDASGLEEGDLRLCEALARAAVKNRHRPPGVPRAPEPEAAEFYRMAAIALGLGAAWGPALRAALGPDGRARLGAAYTDARDVLTPPPEFRRAL